MTINSWPREADPSRQCCCGIARVRACPAPAWRPEGSWQMVLTLGCTSSYTEHDWAKENAKKQGKGTPTDWTREGRSMPQADGCFSSLGFIRLRPIPYQTNVMPISFCNLSLSLLQYFLALSINAAHAEHTLQTASACLYVLPGWAPFRNAQRLLRVSFTPSPMSADPRGPLSLKCHRPRLLWAHTKVISDTCSRAPYWFSIYYHCAKHLQMELKF